MRRTSGLVQMGWCVLCAALVGCQRDSGRPPGDSALAEFAGRIAAQCLAFDSPWVYAHGLLATPDDSPLRAELLRRLRPHLVRVENEVRFRLKGPSEELGEVHPHLVLKTLAECGLAPDLQEALDESARRGFRPPRSYADWNDAAWLLEALARRHPGAADLALGPGWSLGRLAEGCLARVEAGDSVLDGFLDDPDRFRRPSGGGDDSVSGIYAYTCGGQHLLQGVLVAAGQKVLGPEARERVERRVEVFLARLEGEYRFRRQEARRAQASGIPAAEARRESVLLQLKLLGHGLETLGRALDAGLGDREKLLQALRMTRSRLQAILAIYVAEIDPGGDFLDELRTSSRMKWNLWFGDGAHALRGVRHAERFLPPSGAR